MEVDVPLVSPATVTDLHIESIPAIIERLGAVEEHFLITSPEYAMKQLLAYGSGSIFYLGKVFRQNEHGQKHHHEFTMLEWYRIGWDEHQLMDEMIELLSGFLPQCPIKKISYGELFESVLKINPYIADIHQLKDCVARHMEISSFEPSLNDCFDLLFSHCIEPTLKDVTLVYDYPASQAALATITENKHGEVVARRFEVFVDDMELANGYFELTDAAELRDRFIADLKIRAMYKKRSYPLDEQLLLAMQKGLPVCAGVALGVDRLLMKMLKASALKEVLSIK